MSPATGGTTPPVTANLDTTEHTPNGYSNEVVELARRFADRQWKADVRARSDAAAGAAAARRWLNASTTTPALAELVARGLDSGSTLVVDDEVILWGSTSAAWSRAFRAEVHDVLELAHQIRTGER